MGNIASGGPRFVMAGRDRARPSKGYLLIIPIFHHSIIPFQVTPSFVPAWRAVRLLAALLAGAPHLHDLLLLAREFGLEAAELFAQLGGVSAR